MDTKYPNLRNVKGYKECPKQVKVFSKKQQTETFKFSEQNVEIS